MPDNNLQSPASQRGGNTVPDKQALDGISQALAGLRFGSIEIIVHEGKVTQIERKEKFRLNQ